MTDYSQNGWTAPGRSVIVTMTVPGTSVKLPVRAGPAGQLLVAAAARWHREVEPLVPGTCWGYADRTVRGSATDLSNHASGTAIDLNAPQHPLGTAPTANFAPTEIAAIRRIVAAYTPCLRWGGDYGNPAFGGVTGSRPDGMHLEIVASERQCAAVLSRGALPPSPTPRSIEEDFLATMNDQEKALLLEAASSVLFGIAGVRSAGPLALAVNSVGNDVLALRREVEALANKPDQAVDSAEVARQVAEAVIAAGLAEPVIDALAERLRKPAPA